MTTTSLTTTSSGFDVSSGNTLDVLNGGVAVSIAVDGGGQVLVSAGGHTRLATLSGGATEAVYSGGSARSTTVESGATLTVANGGTATRTMIEAGGSESVLSGGLADGTSVLAGGTQSVASGGSESFGTVASGGHEILTVGGLLSGVTLAAGALLTEVGMTVGSGQTMTLAPLDTTVRGFSVGAGGTTAGVISAVGATVEGGGTLTVANGGATDTTLLTGGGALVLDVGATATGAISFAGSGDRLTVFGGTGPAATLSGFAAGDTIDLRAFTTAATVSTSGDTLIVTQGAATLDLNFAAGATLPTEKLPDGAGRLDLVICFCAGTGIRTPAGDVPVETLREGDTVTLADGSTAPVRWLGRQTVARRFADPLTGHPVRIRAGAIAEGLPVRDLLVSPSHAILLDGALVQAGALVNGSSIVRVPAAELPETFSYYHVELEQHALLLAEGVPAESFVDHVERVAFDNWAEHEARFADAPPIAELTLPRAKAPRQIAEATRRHLAARSRAMLPAVEDDAA